MTREEIIDGLERYTVGRLNKDRVHITVEELQRFIDAIKALEQEPTIKALGEELRKARKGIADEKVLIGFNIAVAICNKHLGKSEG